MTTFTAKTLPCFALSLVAVACGQPEGDLEGFASDSLGQITSSLCTDPAAVGYSQPLTLGPGGYGRVAALAPANDPSSPACSDGYVIEATGTTGMPRLYVKAGGDYPTTATDATCSEYQAFLDTYAYAEATNKWVTLFKGANDRATLVKRPDGSYVCRVWITGMLPEPFPLDRVRVVVRAQRFLQFPNVWGIIENLPAIP
jgi:hypothetical protein